MKGEPVESPRSANNNNRELILRKAFDVYDADGSGSIDYSEFKRLIQDLGWPAHEEFIDRAVRVLDEDMSGEIEFSEFQKWTEFAYASRILYRQEMYGLGPRSSSVDGVNMEPVVDEAHDGKKALIIRRTSLTTVVEGREHLEQEKQRSDDEDAEDDDRDRLLVCSSGSGSSARDSDRDSESTRLFMLRFRNRRSSPHIPFREVDGNCTSPFSKAERGGDDSYDAECQASVENEVKLFDDHNIPSARNIDAPVREMATMVLSSRRRSRRTHTSRSRAKSVGILRSRQTNRFDTGGESDAVEKSGDGIVLGPRTESKATVQMRFVCGQFERQEGEGSEPRSRESQGFGESGSESGEELEGDELVESKEEECSKIDEASGSHRREDAADRDRDTE